MVARPDAEVLQKRDRPVGRIAKRAATFLAKKTESPLTLGPTARYAETMDHNTTISPAMRRILNQMRKTEGLPRAQVADVPGKVTRDSIRRIAIEVWKKYPQALIDPEYQLGELTLALVEQEIRQRVDDLRRGVVVKQAALKDYFN